MCAVPRSVKCIIAFSPLHKKPFVFFLIFMGNIKVLFQLQPIIRDRAILEKKELLKKRLFFFKKNMDLEYMIEKCYKLYTKDD